MLTFLGASLLVGVAGTAGAVTVVGIAYGIASGIDSLIHG